MEPPDGRVDRRQLPQGIASAVALVPPGGDPDPGHRRLRSSVRSGIGDRGPGAGTLFPQAAASELDTDVMASPLVSDVAHSGLSVADLDDALVLWCSGLGFVLERTFTLDGEVTAATTGVRGAVIRAATVALDPHRVELLQYDPPRLLESAASPAQVGVVHIALTVSDLDRVIELCAGHGWRPVGTPHRMASGARAGTRIIYLEGALGGFLELIAPPQLL
ncbi:hypothetical protein C5E16_06760 [Clavibacter michiganensis]|uniref:VOC domain-containing protein n=2 Tax=Clavibacter michiganensis TaxID=28447 RepID=A0A2S5VV73_9MICO|nr:hypothetical protein C5E16_06760 [Clavibacter michiganensis]